MNVHGKISGFIRSFLKGGFYAVLVMRTFGIAISTGSAADPFDFNSIGSHPAYLSASAYRDHASLNAIAAKPSSDKDPDSGPIAIAVGDGGTLLRSSDGGESWTLIDRVTPLLPLEISPASGSAASDSPSRGSVSRGSASQASRFGSRKPSRLFVNMPFWHFYDVKWFSQQDVVAVGGSFEPVTGISRGVCLYSDDAGETWTMGNSHELPRLTRLVVSPVADVSGGRRIAAIGDPAESSGVSHFYSHDAGRTWVEDTVARTPKPHPASMVDGTIVDESGRYRVGDYGRIDVFEKDAWKTVRGSDRHAAVAFIVGPVKTIPWSLIGRECLHEHRRVAVATTPGSVSVTDRQYDRVADAMKSIGVTSCQVTASGPSEESERLIDWLKRHRPAVVAIDDSLSDSTFSAWLRAIEVVRRSCPSGREFPKRIVVTKPAADVPNERSSSIWKRSSILRDDALLTGPAVLAGDLSSDALMIAAAGCPNAGVIEVATLDDLSGTIRRDISLASGLALDAGQSLDELQRHIAANRRLQIATARIAQTASLRNAIASAISQPITNDSVVGRADAATAIERTLGGATAVTAPDDRTRLLWGMLVELMNASEFDSGGVANLFAVRRMVVRQLAREASPQSIRRWATWTGETWDDSLEHSQSRANPARPQWAGGGGIEHEQTDYVEPVSGTPDVRANAYSNAYSSSNSRALSPFAIAPASYQGSSSRSESQHESRGRGPDRSSTAILIPQTKATRWQPTRGLPFQSIGQPAASRAASDPFSSTDESEPVVQRVNWDYHPVVMAGRKIQPSSGPVATGPSDSKSPFQLPEIRSRPYLDGRCDESFWGGVPEHSCDRGSIRVCQDDDYVYVAIGAESDAATMAKSTLRLSLDCDGDYLTTVRFEVASDEAKRASVDSLWTISPTWYAARRTDQGGDMTEIAILKLDLPAPMHRIKIDWIPINDRPVWRAMPDADDWIPKTP